MLSYPLNQGRNAAKGSLPRRRHIAPITLNQSKNRVAPWCKMYGDYHEKSKINRGGESGAAPASIFHWAVIGGDDNALWGGTLISWDSPDSEALWPLRELFEKRQRIGC
ncbi:hypothetical protein JTE90_008024 [Oedothorax gibbosus]|uniref:Uncharacterized protein n=1 Tax=Oedothorax gibbosus TaxID=931172 RepID=A0AAV6UWA5_9ARAC|nr:hypothetical protein JTE90_008024 [Oedothorax gibbosus]